MGPQSREALLRLLEPGGAANESLRADMIMHHAAHGPKIQDSDLHGLDEEAAQRLRALQVLQSALSQGRGFEVPELPEIPIPAAAVSLRPARPGERDTVDAVAGMAVHELMIPLPGKRSLRLLEAADSTEATEAFRALGHQDPFGSKAWPSAYLVAERLLSEEVFQQPNYSSASVLELGCGTGLVSLAACMGGASKVLATDQAKVNLDLAQRSARLNGLQLEVEVFDVRSEAPLPRCHGSPFDYVVFSDVLYWPAEAAAFASRAAEAYCEGSTVIMADPGRRRDDFIGALHKELEKRVDGSAKLRVTPEATKFPDHVFEWVSSEVKTASSLFCQEPFLLTLRPKPGAFKVPGAFEIVD